MDPWLPRSAHRTYLDPPDWRDSEIRCHPMSNMQSMPVGGPRQPWLQRLPRGSHGHWGKRAHQVYSVPTKSALLGCPQDPGVSASCVCHAVQRTREGEDGYAGRTESRSRSLLIYPHISRHQRGSPQPVRRLSISSGSERGARSRVAVIIPRSDGFSTCFTRKVRSTDSLPHAGFVRSSRAATELSEYIYVCKQGCLGGKGSCPGAMILSSASLTHSCM